jgi:hypothetical protein
MPLVEFEMRDPDTWTQRLMLRVKETQVALAQVKVDPSPENVAALHRLHAEHLREDGDPAGAARAEERAKRAEAMGVRP